MAVSFSRELTPALGRHVQGWKNSLNEAWHPLAMQWAEGLTPTSISSTNVEHIFPRLDVTDHRHVFKAFDNLSPAAVRVVLLGQDPYPNEAQATGRAFEQGDLESFRAQKPRVAHSLNMMLRMMVKATVIQADERPRTKREDLRTLLAQAPLKVVSPTQVFDRLVAQGVMFLNASLTISKSASRRNNDHLRGHLAFWRPFVQAVLRDLLAPMARSNSPTLGHPKFPQAGRSDYDYVGVMAMREAASFRR